MTPLSDTVRKLIAEHVDSLEKLEALVSIFRTSASSGAPKVSGSYPIVVGFDEALAALVTSGLLAVEAGSYRVREPHRGTVASLLALYEAERSAVLSHLSRQAIGRVRRSIPDAFSGTRGGRGRGNDDR
ncbi:MAG: hypothetical protein HOV80_17940 [Polyangiaceae bacterium]|nr:hypothetical protein [Polyangiaceae bacterium]